MAVSWQEGCSTQPWPLAMRNTSPRPGGKSVDAIKAGILQQGSIDLMRQSGVGDPVLRDVSSSGAKGVAASSRDTPPAGSPQPVRPDRGVRPTTGLVQPRMQREWPPGTHNGV